MLSELKRYLQERGQVSLADVARHFDVPPDVARQMLQVWVKKGKAHQTLATASCGSSCSQCDPASTELYLWGPATRVVKLEQCRLGSS